MIRAVDEISGSQEVFLITSNVMSFVHFTHVAMKINGNDVNFRRRSFIKGGLRTFPVSSEFSRVILSGCRGFCHGFAIFFVEE